MPSGFMGRGIFGALLAGALLFSGCGEDEKVRTKLARVEVSTPLVLSLPGDSHLGEILVMGNGHVRLADRVRLGASGASSLVVNFGTEETTAGVDSQVFGSIWSNPLTILRERSIVHGDVLSATGIQTQNGVFVHGESDPQWSLPSTRTLESALSFVGGADHVRNADAPPLSLPPGQYGHVTIHSRSGLQLTSQSGGKWYFRSLTIEPQASFIVPSGVPVVVHVENQFQFTGDFSFQSGSGNSGDVLFSLATSATVSLERALSGTFFAPRATMRLAPAHREFSGALFVKNLQVEPDLNIQHVPFRHWGVLFPPKITAVCVSERGADDWIAKFIYENQLDETVSIPVGSENQVAPPPSDRQWPTTFAPGTQGVWLPFVGASISWSLAGSETIADRTLRRCVAGDYDPIVSPGLESIAPSRATQSAEARQIADVKSYVRLLSQSERHDPPGLAASIVKHALNQSGSAVVAQANGGPGNRPGFQLMLNVPEVRHDGNYCNLRVEMRVDGETRTRDLGDCGCGAGEACLSNGIRSTGNWTEVFHFPQGSEVDAEIIVSTTGVVNPTRTVRMSRSFTVDAEEGGITLSEGCHTTSGWGFCFDSYVDHRSGLCTSWPAQYVDSGYGERIMGSSNITFSEAARARASLYRSDEVDPVWTGYLNGNGCIATGDAPYASDLMFREDSGEPAEISLLVHPEFCSTNQSGVRPRNEEECEAARGIVFRVFTVPEEVLSYFPDTGEIGVIDEGEKQAAALTSEHEITIDVRNDLPPSFLVAGYHTPPSFLRVAIPGHDDVTRVAAFVSRVYQTQDRGVGNTTYTIMSNDSCPSDSPETAGDACVSPHTNFLYVGNHKSGFDPLVYTLNRWKYTIAHEAGHMFQQAVLGRLPLLITTFVCDPSDPLYVEDALGVGRGGCFDPPGTPPLCRCDHVDSANRYHCIQSREISSAAQAEGFAQFYASKIWNDPAEDCVFVYYKEMLAESCVSEECTAFTPPDANGTSLQNNRPPFPLRCDQAHLWRNQYCGADGTLGTELDWMSFYWSINNIGDNTISMAELYNIYRDAFETGSDVDWERFAASTLATLGVDSAAAQAVAITGDVTGVSLDTSLP